VSRCPEVSFTRRGAGSSNIVSARWEWGRSWSKPKRHVTGVAELTEDEARELGPLLKRSAALVDVLVEPEQIYTCLWSHAGGTPVHIHYVVQPATRELMDTYGVYGPHLQLAMFDADIAPPEAAVEAFADRARAAFCR